MIADLLYPASCVSCEKPGAWLCFACQTHLIFFSSPLEVPQLPSRAPLAVSSIFACGSYKQRAWARVITAIKYEGLTALEPMLAVLIQRWGKQVAAHWIFEDGEGWTIIPSPTNPDHMEERGMDHLEVWTHVFQNLLPRATVDRGILKRFSGAPAHASIGVSGAREAAIQGEMMVVSAVPERVILLDDVYTTGATLQTGARLLQEAGAARLEVIVAATSF